MSTNKQLPGVTPKCESCGWVGLQFKTAEAAQRPENSTHGCSTGDPKMVFVISRGLVALWEATR